MDSQGNGVCKQNELTILSPDVFFHPLWKDFYITDPGEAGRLTHALAGEVKQLSSKRQWLDACRAELVCAYLQNLSGNASAAMRSLHHVHSIATHHDLFHVNIWAYWAESAICAQGGAYTQSVTYLQILERELYRVNLWILADFINLVRQSLIDISQLDHINLRFQPRNQDAVEMLIQQLLCWGNPFTASVEDTSHAGEARLISAGWPDNIASDRSAKSGSSRAITPLWTFWKNVLVFFHRVPAIEHARETQTIPVVTEKQSQFQNPLDGPRLNEQGENIAQANSVIISPPGANAAREQLSVFQSGQKEEPQPDLPACQKGIIEIQMYFLGSFRFYRNEQFLTDWPSQKSLSILKFLAANREKPIPKDILMDQFWTEMDAEVARRNLHQAIYALRQALKKKHPDFPYILFENDCYRLNPQLEIWLDFEEFEKHVRLGIQLEAANKIQKAMDEYGIAEALYQGDFLEEDLYEDWPGTQRSLFRSMYLEMLDRVSLYHYEQKQYYAAILICQKTLAKDNCSEQAYRCMIRCYLAQGQRQLAAREFQTCVQTLKEELGITPSDETLALYPLIFTAKV